MFISCRLVLILVLKKNYLKRYTGINVTLSSVRNQGPVVQSWFSVNPGLNRAVATSIIGGRG